MEMKQDPYDYDVDQELREDPKCSVHLGWLCTWFFIFVFVLGGLLLLFVGLLHFTHTLVIADEEYCACSEDNSGCTEDEKTCGSVSGDVYGAMYVGMGLCVLVVALSVACCCTLCCKRGNFLTAFRAPYIVQHMQQSPEALALAREIHKDQVRALKARISAASPVESIQFSVMAESGAVFSVMASPENTVDQLQQYLQASELSIGCGTLVVGSTLESQCVMDGTILRAEQVHTERSELVLPSHMEIELQELLGDAPKPEQYRRQSTRLVCCRCDCSEPGWVG
eukprot:TRINITY_DN3262_c0_g1_i4.p1 TRINITY_DN3262_c0_g1~~TRINITY_DN3262_c0_g1_i4.p1  ORF type:complete len:282 (-),score=70.76 TRINITY_DN3262_c0_g1_i4:448-1293(-)